MTGRLLGFGGILLMVAALFVVPTGATSLQQQLDFMGGAGGTLTYTLGSSATMGNPLSISGASISSLQALPADAFLTITGGSLAFTTANCDKGCLANALPGGFAMSSPTFAYGGGLTLTGTIPGFSGTLLSGSFQPTSNPQAGQKTPVAPNATLSSKTHTGGFDGSLAIDSIAPQIYTDFLPLIFQVPSSTGKGYISEIFVNLSFSPTSGVFNHTYTSGTWSGTVNSTDVIVKPIPEPSMLLLMASVLLVAGGFLRRKLHLTA